jgi:hypothetical protein
MRERRDAHRFLVRKPDRRRPIENLGVDGKTILK